MSVYHDFLIIRTKLLQRISFLVGFGRSNRIYFDRSSDLARFAEATSLQKGLKSRLLKNFNAQWHTTAGLITTEVTLQFRIPAALTSELVRAANIDLTDICPLFRSIADELLPELLRRLHTVVSLQKDVLINSKDSCSRFYILRNGSLQAAALAPDADVSAGGLCKKGSAGSSSRKGKTWKAKLQVRDRDTTSGHPPCEAAWTRA